jgi:hypothetical protein
MKKKFIILFSLATTLVACSKSVNEASPLSTQQLILGNWSLFSFHSLSQKAGVPKPLVDTTIYPEARYFMFASNGKAKVKIDGTANVFDYLFTDNSSKLKLGPSTYTIVKLDNFQLMLRTIEVKGDTTNTVDLSLLK